MKYLPLLVFESVKSLCLPTADKLLLRQAS